MKEEQKGEIIIYQSEEGSPKIEVRLENENVWLTQKMMSELFQTTPQNITIHLKNIFEEGELNEDATCKDFLQVQNEGTRKVERKQKFYNIDAIISVGYRIKSSIATKFRMWATERLKEYIVKGFTMDDERLKQMGGGGYWYELLNRIRDIRSSEIVIFQLDKILSATGQDILNNSGKLSHKNAISKAKSEFKKYQIKTLSPVEETYLENLKDVQKKLGNKR